MCRRTPGLGRWNTSLDPYPQSPWQRTYDVAMACIICCINTVLLTRKGSSLPTWPLVGLGNSGWYRRVYLPPEQALSCPAPHESAS